MTSIDVAAAVFLSHRRIAVTGVSRAPRGHGSNAVYQRLRARGYTVFAVNPNTPSVEGDPCFPDLAAIPGGVEAVVLAARPARALEHVMQCHALGIRYVWMHRGCGTGSASPEAAEWARTHGMEVIDGGCPLMFGSCADPVHAAARVVLTLTGNVPRKVRAPYAMTAQSSRPTDR